MTDEALRAEIKQAIIRSLRLPITAAEIGDDMPLLAGGSVWIQLTCWNWCWNSNAPLAHRSRTRKRDTGAPHRHHHRRVRAGQW